MCSSASQTGNVQESPLGGPENSNCLAELESYRAVKDTLRLADSVLAQTTSKVPCLPLVLSSPALNFTRSVLHLLFVFSAARCQTTYSAYQDYLANCTGVYTVPRFWSGMWFLTRVFKVAWRSQQPIPVMVFTLSELHSKAALTGLEIRIITIVCLAPWVRPWNQKPCYQTFRSVLKKMSLKMCSHFINIHFFLLEKKGLKGNDLSLDIFHVLWGFSISRFKKGDNTLTCLNKIPLQNATRIS